MSIGLPNLSFWGRRRLPIVLQTEVAECGLASLCMVATYWGHRIDLASLRRRFVVSMRGANLKALTTIAMGLGLQSRAVKCDLDGVEHLRLPCVLHWDLNHFVVLRSITKRFLVIHDPAIGERRMTLKAFSDHFTGVALELWPGTAFKREEEVRQFSILSLMGRPRDLSGSLIQFLVLGVALQLCAVLAPFFLQWVVDDALVTGDRDLVSVLGCGFLLLVVLQTAIGALRSWITTVLSTNLNLHWLGNTFAHMLQLPLQFFEKRHTGDIVSRFSSIRAIQSSLTVQFVEGAVDGVLVLVTLALMLAYSATLGLIACCAVGIYLCLRLLQFRGLREATAEQIVLAARQNTHFIESVRGVQSIRLFGRGEQRYAGWMNALVDQFNAELSIARLTVSFRSANALLFGAERVVIIWLAALAILDGRLTTGMMFAFISYKDQFSLRMAGLVDKFFEWRLLRLHGERVADIVMADTESNRDYAEVDPREVKPTIEIRNLSFRYSDGEPFVLRNLSLQVMEGECVAVTGSSGCGKSTLVKLILGLLEPTEGEILIGGVKLTSLGPENYRAMLGTVMQDDVLFAGSIADNICFFDPAPDREHILACAVQAEIANEVARMPMGYSTLVGDIGTGLSGGQKQRLLLARALYKRPRILILDEATSHLDVRNERAVNEAIQKLDLTRLVVAHRPETISMAQRVVILTAGGLDVQSDVGRNVNVGN